MKDKISISGLGLSDSSFIRGDIPMTKEDGKRWTMTREEFVEYYESVFNA